MTIIGNIVDAEIIDANNNKDNGNNDDTYNKIQCLEGPFLARKYYFNHSQYHDLCISCVIFGSCVCFFIIFNAQRYRIYHAN